jgi:hypothetical protein
MMVEAVDGFWNGNGFRGQAEADRWFREQKDSDKGMYVFKV